MTELKNGELVSFPVTESRAVLGYNRSNTKRVHQEIFEDFVYDVGDLGPNPNIVDCGANVGFATAWFAIRYPHSTVVALEPEPMALDLLRRNVAENSWTNVTIVGAAAHTHAGTSVLHMDADRPAHPRCSLLPQRMQGRTVEVRTVPLSDYIPAGRRVDLLKMDIEGAESGVLAELDASGALSRIDRIAMEFHHNVPGAGRLSDALTLIERAGFAYTIRARRHSASPTAFQNVMIYSGRVQP